MKLIPYRHEPIFADCTFSDRFVNDLFTWAEISRQQIHDIYNEEKENCRHEQ